MQADTRYSNTTATLGWGTHDLSKARHSPWTKVAGDRKLIRAPCTVCGPGWFHAPGTLGALLPRTSHTEAGRNSRSSHRLLCCTPCGHQHQPPSGAMLPLSQAAARASHNISVEARASRKLPTPQDSGKSWSCHHHHHHPPPVV